MVVFNIKTEHCINVPVALTVVLGILYSERDCFV